MKGIFVVLLAFVCTQDTMAESYSEQFHRAVDRAEYSDLEVPKALSGEWLPFLTSVIKNKNSNPGEISAAYQFAGNILKRNSGDKKAKDQFWEALDARISIGVHDGEKLEISRCFPETDLVVRIKRELDQKFGDLDSGKSKRRSSISPEK